VIVLLRIIKYSSEFDVILASSGSNMSKSRFLKLFWLSFIMLAVVLPLQTYVLYYNIVANLPWQPFSWNAVHGPEWNTVFPIPTGGEVPFPDRWITIAASFLLFLFYGLGNDAINLYRNTLVRLGLGRFFPTLYAPYVGSSYGKGLLSSISTKTKSFVGKTRTTISR
jgi:pheromone a factor receptor